MRSVLKGVDHVSIRIGLIVYSISYTSMASQIVGASASFQLESFVRGHHVYFRNWTPTVGELMLVKREIVNEYDPFAVAIWKNGVVVGHVPKLLSRVIAFFLNYYGNVAFCEVTERRVNRGAGLGIEVPCVYKFYGCQVHVKKLQELLSKL